MCQFVFNVGSFDIDDFLLNVSGALLFYFLIRKKGKRLIEKLFLPLKCKNKVIRIFSYFVYFLLLLFLLLLSGFQFYNIYYDYSLRHIPIDTSNLVCVLDEKTYIIDDGNYRYYTKCNYGDSFILVGDFKWSLQDFIKSEYFNLSYEEKLGLLKEEIITNVLVNVDEKIGKTFINASMNSRNYWYHIKSIIVTKDGIDYDYRQYLKELEQKINTVEIDLSPLEELVYVHPKDEYYINRGKYYQVLSCTEGGRLSGNPTYSYTLPLEYEITNQTCQILNNSNE